MNKRGKRDRCASACVGGFAPLHPPGLLILLRHEGRHWGGAICRRSRGMSGQDIARTMRPMAPQNRCFRGRFSARLGLYHSKPREIPSVSAARRKPCGRDGDPSQAEKLFKGRLLTPQLLPVPCNPHLQSLPPTLQRRKQMLRSVGTSQSGLYPLQHLGIR